jgi:hypothetical protein
MYTRALHRETPSSDRLRLAHSFFESSFSKLSPATGDLTVSAKTINGLPITRSTLSLTPEGALVVCLADDGSEDAYHTCTFSVKCPESLLRESPGYAIWDGPADGMCFARLPTAIEVASIERLIVAQIGPP